MSNLVSTFEFARNCPVYEKDHRQFVDARKLHHALGVGRDFSTWIRGRITQYGFEEGVDFEINSIITDSPVSGSQERIDYQLSVNMAKELAMVENNAIGRRVRRYFIACEEAFRAAYLERLEKLAIEQEKAKREISYYAHLAGVYSDRAYRFKRQRSQIASSREAKTLQENRQLKRENAELKNTLGIGKEWIRVAAIPWLLDYFKESSAMRRAVGIELSVLSKKMKREIRHIGEPPAGTKRVYHAAVIDAFHLKVKWNPDFMARFRRRETIGIEAF